MSNEVSSTILRVMPREMRLMSERILSLSSLPKGFFLTVGDFPMYSQKLGLGGFRLFEERAESFKAADPSHLRIIDEDSDGKIVLDAAGEHAWFVLPSALDLLGEITASTEEGQVTVNNVRDPQELAIAADYGPRIGLTVTVNGNVLKARKAEAAVVDETLRALLEEGAEIDAGLWWSVYHHAKQALATDSLVSRRHAGAVIVNEDGTVIGRKDNDDETDVNFLSSRISEREKEGTNA